MKEEGRIEGMAHILSHYFFKKRKKERWLLWMTPRFCCDHTKSEKMKREKKERRVIGLSTLRETLLLRLELF